MDVKSFVPYWKMIFFPGSMGSDLVLGCLFFSTRERKWGKGEEMFPQVFVFNAVFWWTNGGKFLPAISPKTKPRKRPPTSFRMAMSKTSAMLPAEKETGHTFDSSKDFSKQSLHWIDLKMSTPFTWNEKKITNCRNLGVLTRHGTFIQNLVHTYFTEDRHK